MSAGNGAAVTPAVAPPAAHFEGEHERDPQFAALVAAGRAAQAQPTNKDILDALQVLTDEVRGLRTQAEAIAGAATEAMEQVKSGGLMGILGSLMGR